MNVKHFGETLYVENDDANQNWTHKFDTEIVQVIEFSELIVVHLSYGEHDSLVMFDLIGRALGEIRSPVAIGGGWNGFTRVKKILNQPPKVDATCFNGGVYQIDFRDKSLTLHAFTK